MHIIVLGRYHCLSAYLFTFVVACCVSILSIFPTASFAQQSPTLINGWLTTLNSPPTLDQGTDAALNNNVAWSHAFALLHKDVNNILTERRYISAELQSLALRSQIEGDMVIADAVNAWEEELQKLNTNIIRTPGRFDLLALGSAPRKAPSMDIVRLWGICEIPDWIEVWSLNGVTRLNWEQHSNLKEVFQALPRKASAVIDYSYVISPQGQILRRGIASWNYQETPLAPGSRIITELPNRQGLGGALSLYDAYVERDLINQRLPELIATYLPGDHCTTWQNN